MRRLSVILAVTLLICACSTTDAPTGATGPLANDARLGSSSAVLTRVDLGTLGGPSSYATDINSRDVVVGWSETAAGTTHAFRWRAATGMADLGTLPGDAMSRAIAILDGGPAGSEQILGVSGGNGPWTPVVWSASGSIRALPIPLLASFSVGFPEGFNARGDVVGWDAGAPGQHGWIWSATTGKYDLSANVRGGSNEGSASAVNASGVVVLTTRASTCHSNPQCWRSHLWTRRSGYRALGTPRGDPEAAVTGLALNDEGTVVGWLKRGTAPATVPYRWDATTGFVALPNQSTDGSAYGYAMAVNATGAAVGADREPTSGSIVATAWPTVGRIVRLSPEDPNASVAVAINKPGTIAGWASVSSDVNHAVIWSAFSRLSNAQRAALSTSAGIGQGAASRTRERVSTKSTPCLADGRAIMSRQTLFACVLKADHAQ